MQSSKSMKGKKGKDDVPIKPTERQYKTNFLNKKEIAPLEQPHIRILDFLFPLEDINIDSKEGDPYLHSIIGSLDFIKRPSSVQRDIQKNLYVINFEEKWPSQQVWKGYENINYFLQFLKKFQHVESSNLAAQIINYIQYMELNEKFKSLVDFNDMQSQYAYQIQIEYYQLNFIKFCPYFMIKYNLDIQKSKGLLSTIETNNQMLDLLGYDPEYFMMHFAEFEVQKNLKTRNWMKFYTRFLLFLTDSICQHMTVTSEELILFDKDGYELEGKFSFHKQKYFMDKTQYEEIYIVYLPDKEIDLNEVKKKKVPKTEKAKRKKKGESQLEACENVQKEGVKQFIKAFYS